MPQRYVRATHSSRIVLVISSYLHRIGEGRRCAVCETKWTARRDNRGLMHAWRDGVPLDSAILDYSGNNVVVECCRPDRSSRGARTIVRQKPSLKGK